MRRSFQRRIWNEQQFRAPNQDWRRSDSRLAQRLLSPYRGPPAPPRYSPFLFSSANPAESMKFDQSSQLEAAASLCWIATTCANIRGRLWNRTNYHSLCGAWISNCCSGTFRTGSNLIIQLGYILNARRRDSNSVTGALHCNIPTQSIGHTAKGVNSAAIRSKVGGPMTLAKWVTTVVVVITLSAAVGLRGGSQT